MRIGFVYDALYPFVPGGAERRYYELARRLSTSHEVHYITWRWWDGPRTTRLDGVTLHGVGRPPALYGKDGKRTVREAVGFAVRVLPALARQRLDIVDCSATPYLPLYAAAAAAHLTHTPLVATWHEFWGDHWLDYLAHRPLLARAARATEQLARRLGDRRVAVSEFTLRRMGARPDAQHLVVPNAVDRSHFSEEPEGRGGERWDVAYVGRLIDAKRVDLLLDAVELLRSTARPVRCAIVGDGPERAALEARVAELGLERDVRFLGRLPQERASEVLRSARVFAMPSEREGFGITVIEAMAAGSVPVVVRGPHTAAAELVRDGVDGRTCEPDPGALAAAIQDLLSDVDRLAAMRSAAREAVRGYDWDQITAAMERAYRLAVAGRPALARAT